MPLPANERSKLIHNIWCKQILNEIAREDFFIRKVIGEDIKKRGKKVNKIEYPKLIY